ncbi:protein of unknown function [Aminobacter niigataensis]|nr:protein of unknown function [Aminobacter niigataensis]
MISNGIQSLDREGAIAFSDCTGSLVGISAMVWFLLESLTDRLLEAASLTSGLGMVPWQPTLNMPQCVMAGMMIRTPVELIDVGQNLNDECVKAVPVGAASAHPPPYSDVA